MVVDNLIVHDVPKKFSRKYVKANPEIDAEDIILSEVPTEVDQELTRFFHNRITSTIGSSNSFEIEFDKEAQEASVPEILNEYFEIGNEFQFPLDNDDSIRLTQEIAKMLHKVQNATNPGGMLLFIPCHSNKQNGIAILKVEREEGVRIQRDSNNLGQTTFNMQHVKDLMLTKNTKLFKIVLFYQDNDEIIGFLCDQQQGILGKREVANFFLKDFLGCKLKDEPQVTSKKFFEATMDYINNSTLSDSDMIDLHTHLISELTNNSNVINTHDFALAYLPDSNRQEFMDSLNKLHIPNSFLKDVTLIAEKIRKVRYDLACGIRILGTKETMKEKLNMSQLENGDTKIEITDRLQRVESK